MVPPGGPLPNNAEPGPRLFLRGYETLFITITILMREAFEEAAGHRLHLPVQCVWALRDDHPRLVWIDVASPQLHDLAWTLSPPRDANPAHYNVLITSSVDPSEARKPGGTMVLSRFNCMQPDADTNLRRFLTDSEKAGVYPL
jgi:hypothetical protein